MKRGAKILGRLALLLAITSLSGPAGAQAPGADPPPGKKDTGRAITIETVVACNPTELWELWTTEAGVRSFFAPGARIEPRVGGRYELTFDPAGDPEGEREGTKGCKILSFEPSSLLAFEWKGREVMVEMNTPPLPTWVELRFTPLAGEPSRTKVSFAHRGFGEGGSWELGWVFFSGAWNAVMQSLQTRCSKLHEGPPRRDEEAALAPQPVRAGRGQPAR
ncbi:MAG TPA: SRPBCC domain-containing protein [Thermoanaerobaculia bacterium]|nr:SRPBCC domain-containing protein [Thermoanaerobaculia bacterium]